MTAREQVITNEIIEACRMRLAGLTPEEIAERLDRSTNWAYKHTKGFEPPKPVVKRITRTLRKTRDPMWLPKDPALRARVTMLARRGFDVPPSKQADYDNLAFKNVPVPERRKILGLE